MFRESRRKKQTITAEEITDILKTARRAVLSVNGDNGYPYAFPVNYYYDETDGCIYIHCARVGHKIDSIRNCDKVCFTTWKQTYQEPGDWAYHVSSVVIMGRAGILTWEDSEKLKEKLKLFGMKYFPVEEEAEVDDLIRKYTNGVQMIVIRPEHISGKEIIEK